MADTESQLIHPNQLLFGRTLREAGMTDKKGNWTGKYGIRGEVDFLRNPLAQERALSDLMKRTEVQVQFKNLRQHIGNQIDGIKSKITVTMGGLMAAAHRRGATGVENYFRFLQNNKWTTKGRRILPEFAEVETRLREFEAVPYNRP